jgi:hypothetical protein
MTRSVLSRLALAAAAACVLLAATPARAVTLTAAQDNNVLKSAATTVQADGATFTVKEATTGQGNARLGYLKFDLTGVTPGVDGNSATFTASTTGAATADFTLRAYALNSGVTGYDWSETGITYNNRPAFNNTANPLVNTAEVTQVGPDFTLTNTSVAGSQTSFTFTDWDTFRQVDNTMSLLLLVTTQSNNGPTLSFASSENGNAALRPTLMISDTVPEPASAVLVAAGAAGLLLQRPPRRSRCNAR